MGEIALAYAGYDRSGLPTATTLNMLSEQSPTKPASQWSMLARPGLETFKTVGTAPIRGIYQKSGLLSEASFIVADTTAYRLTSAGVATALTGAIAGDELVEMDGGLDADSNTVIRVATGSALYKHVSSGLGVVDEGIAASSVAYWKGYWLYTAADTDAAFYQEPASAVWSPIDFASAEYQPDKLKGVRVFGDIAALPGAATMEFWRLTGDASAPMAPISGLAFDIGCRNIASCVNCAGTLIWVTQHSSVVLSEGGPPRIISDNGLAEQIRRTSADDINASFYIKDQHPCYVLHLGNTATWVYDLSTERWQQFSSLSYDYWRARLFTNMGDAVICADRQSNQIYTLNPDIHGDGDDEFARSFCGFLAVPEGRVDLANVQLDCLVGQGTASGQGSAPVIRMDISRDDGKTWQYCGERSLGATGQYNIRPRWNALGEVGAPGAIFRWQMSDPVAFTVSAARYNVD